MTEITVSLVKELRERTGLGMMDCKKALQESNGDIEKAIEDLRKASGLKAARKAARTAAEGVALAKLAEDRSCGVMVEINSETDFAAREATFADFANTVVETVFSKKETDIAALLASGLEQSRLALVQKIGENVTVRRAAVVEEEGAKVGAYVHGNNRIAVLVLIRGGDEQLAKDLAMHVAAVNPMVVRAENVPKEVLDKESEIYAAQARDSGKPADLVEKIVSGRLKKFVEEVSLLEQPFVKDPDLRIARLVKDANAEVLGFTRFEVGEGIEREKADFAAEVKAQAQQSRD